MHPWIKRSALGAAICLAVGASTLGVAALVGDQKMKRNVQLPAYPIALKSDSASIEHGRYLFQTKGCADCHAENGGGHLFINDPDSGMQVGAPNISKSALAVVAAYSAEDWERSIRHGVKPNGEPLMVMPAEEYARLSDADLEDLVAYVRQIPAVDGGPATLKLPLMVRALYGVGMIQDAAEKIDHSLPPQAEITPAVSHEYGEYLAHSCQGCHGDYFSGGTIPGAPPAWPAAANLTPGGNSVMPFYPDADAFKSMLRSGTRADGKAISPVMPFTALARMNDQDMEALYLFLTSLPARDGGNR